MTEKQTISKEQIKKTAQLARIDINEKEEKKFAKEIGDVLEYFKNISEVEAQEIEKVDHYDLQKNQLRKDEVAVETHCNASLQKKENIRKQFPKRKDDYLKVKAVL